MDQTSSPVDAHALAPLERRFGLLQATALNISNMVGVGPFITIPSLMAALNGPQSLLGWAVALLITIPDSLIWSELGAAMPRAGGTYVYLKEAFGAAKWGRLMAFLFIWQFLLSGPMEIASGYIGFANYLGYLWPERTPLERNLCIVVLGLSAMFLLYRKIGSIGKITVSLWIGTMITTLSVTALGAWNFNPARAFDFPAGGFQFSLGFLLGLGTAARIGIYDFLGYYDVCYIGEEVSQPERNIPRSVIISLLVVAGIYIGINLSLIGTISWREMVPVENNPVAESVVSVFVERLVGPGAAKIFTVFILWTAFASIFALLLGYSRIPYAAARDGYFFRAFAAVHPKGHFPHVSLVVIGVTSIAFSFFSLGAVIDALILSRIVIQFMGQILAIKLLRDRDYPMPFKMWFYPVPCFFALAGWIFILATANVRLLWQTVGLTALGIAAFLIWSRINQTWPFSAVGGEDRTANS